MKRALGILALVILAAGCGSSDQPADATANAQPVGKPNADEAKECIAVYLGQCGWKDVQLVNLTDSKVPADANIAGEAWAYTFHANYVNLFGEKLTSENWVAVVARVDGQNRRLPPDRR